MWSGGGQGSRIGADRCAGRLQLGGDRLLPPGAPVSGAPRFAHVLHTVPMESSQLSAVMLSSPDPAHHCSTYGRARPSRVRNPHPRSPISRLLCHRPGDSDPRRRLPGATERERHSGVGRSDRRKLRSPTGSARARRRRRCVPGRQPVVSGGPAFRSTRRAPLPLLGKGGGEARLGRAPVEPVMARASSSSAVSCQVAAPPSPSPAD